MTTMTGPEFREARIAAGLSYRRAADHLGMSMSTIQRWEESGPTSEINFDLGTEYPEHYALGQLLGLAERAHRGRLPERLYRLRNPQRLLAETAPYIAADPECLRIATQVARTISADIGRHMPAEGLSMLWLGYYHQRAAVGLGSDDEKEEDPQ